MADEQAKEEHTKIVGAEAREQGPGSRDEILRAAMTLFANRGFHETSMSEVAREARVSKALIFWHFKTKEELFIAVLNRLLEPYFIDFAEELTALDEREQILCLVQMYLLFVRDHASSVRFFLAQLLHDEHRGEGGLGSQVMQLYEGYRSLLTSLIGQAQQRGLCAHGYSSEGAAAFLLSALNGFLIEFLFMGRPALDPQHALVMVREWLFGETKQGNPDGGQAVA
jgi:AcrR family transcriptional regulator